MAVSRGSDPTPELTTTRLGGGRKAWLVALGALTVLGGFVYLGLTGPATPSNTPQPKPSTAVAVAAQSPRPTPNLNEVTSIRVDSAAPLLYQYLGTGLSLNGHGTLAVLDAVDVDHYRGIYRIPYALAQPTARLEFDAVTASVSHDDLDRIGTWEFPIDAISEHLCCPSVTVLDTSEPPQGKTLANPDFSRVATNGYRLTVTVDNQADAALMTIDIAVNPDQFFPQARYSLTFGPSDATTRFDLETFALGGYDGQAPIPNSMLGSTIPVTLYATPTDVSSSPALEVGTWSVQVPAKLRNDAPTQVDVMATARPITSGEAQLLANGYYLSLAPRLYGDHFVLIAGLNVLSSPVPLAPTTR